MSTAIDPHKQDSFWVKHTKQLLKRDDLTPEYRHRLESIRDEALKGLGKHGTVSFHYPMERK